MPSGSSRAAALPEPMAAQIERDMELFQTVIRERQLKFDN